MSIKFESSDTHFGFSLKESCDFDGELFVLTGKNGCGKSRLLQGIKANKVYVVDATNFIQYAKEELVVLDAADLIPVFPSHYDSQRLKQEVDFTLSQFLNYRSSFDLPLDEAVALNFNQGNAFGNRNPFLHYEDLYSIVRNILDDGNRLAQDLTPEELTLYLFRSSKITAMHNIGEICNNYIEKIWTNRFNRFLIESGDFDGDIYHAGKEEMDRIFAQPPWEIFNEILEKIFEGKFTLSLPNNKWTQEKYIPRLMEKSTETYLEASAFSTGEKTLLWLALLFFNCEYKPQIFRPPKVLFLDEPDAYLHPKMIAKMFEIFNFFSKKFDTKFFITSHSPTTVALSPSENVYVLLDSVIAKISKDEAISQLLDGVSQISISPDNRRQIFVEGNDAEIYQEIYRVLKGKSELIDSKISLTFMSAGATMHDNHIREKLKSVLKLEDEEKIKEITFALNGNGNCEQVKSQVKQMRENGARHVNGIVDWDRQHRSDEFISVLGEDKFYTIENILLDPIIILELLHLENSKKYSMLEVCGKDVHKNDWLQDISLMQASIDYFIEKVLERPNKKDAELSYFSNETFLTDKEYLCFPGHRLQDRVVSKFPEFKGQNFRNKLGGLSRKIFDLMIAMHNQRFIPKDFESVIAKVQR